jgi:hypothetical protein
VRAILIALCPFLVLAAMPREAHADPPPPELMAKLAAHAEAFEAMRTHASYAIAGELDETDADGKTTSTKTGAARVEADGHATHTVVLRYAEDGKDETADAQKRARAADEKRAHRPDAERIHMPFLERERANYTFDEVEHDPADPTRVRLTFTPKQPSERTIEGSAWVDANAGQLVSAGFKVSRTPIFVDHIHITVEFGAETSLGHAVSRVTVDGGGGILFFHKHFVGTATLSDYRVVP